MTGRQLIEIILLILGFVAFLVAVFGPFPDRVRVIAAGLACWILSALIAAWPQ